MRNKIHVLLTPSEDRYDASYWVDVLIITLIVLNVIALVFQTMPTMSEYEDWFVGFEIFSVLLFTIEYILRIYSCTANPLYSESFSGRVKFMITPMMLIDLMTILPFYLVFMGVDGRVVRMFRLVRIFRLLRLARYIESMDRIGTAVHEKKSDIIVALTMILVMLLISSSLMFFAENDAQPEVFSSIPAAMWWGVATLTTVGYGDIYPVTMLGKILGSIIAILGIAAIAVPTGILSSAFSDLSQKHK